MQKMNSMLMFPVTTRSDPDPVHADSGLNSILSSFPMK